MRIRLSLRHSWTHLQEVRERRPGLTAWWQSLSIITYETHERVSTRIGTDRLCVRIRESTIYILKIIGWWQTLQIRESKASWDGKSGRRWKAKRTQMTKKSSSSSISMSLSSTSSSSVWKSLLSNLLKFGFENKELKEESKKPHLPVLKSVKMH